MSISCDVLVVGAGPAGASSAMGAALLGSKVICIEKKKEIGNQVKCAEGIGNYLFPYLPFKIPKKFLDWKMEGMYLYTEDIRIKKTGEFWEAYSINRKLLEKWLVKKAGDAGANILTGAELVGLDSDGYNVKKGYVKKNGKIIEISPKKVIAADGSESKTMELLGLPPPKRGILADVCCWEMTNLKLTNSHFEQVFFGNFTPKGYGFIFPKNKGTANVGVGGIYPEKKIDYYFEQFLDLPEVKKQISGAKFVSNKSKKASFGYLLKKRNYGNVYPVGDVANDNFKPFVEGILPSIITGYALGKTINAKVTERPLGNFFSSSDALLELTYKLYNLKDSKKGYLLLMSTIAEIVKPDEVPYFLKRDYNFLHNAILSRLV
jgi:digeranylgeranylglycerophospholipid reductase